MTIAPKTFATAYDFDPFGGRDGATLAGGTALLNVRSIALVSSAPTLLANSMKRSFCGFCLGFAFLTAILPL